MNIIKANIAERGEWLRGSVTFAAGTSGAIAAHDVFVITGMVSFAFYARCTGALTSGGVATIAYGNAGVTNGLGVVTTCTTIDPGDALTPTATAWMEAATFSAYGAQLQAESTGTDIIATIADATITGGTLEYYLLWQPISVGATVALGAELTAI